MRAALVACLVGSSLLAWPGAIDADRGAGQETLWDRTLAPHAREITAILRHAAELHKHASEPIHAAGDEALRRRLLEDARGMLRHAIARAPDHTGVLELLAYVEEALGHVEPALAAYARYMELVPLEQVSLELCVRHGALLGRAGQPGLAKRGLRRCLSGPAPLARRGSSQRSHAVFLLASLHAQRGRLTAAIELLLQQSEVARPDPLLLFALAVLYDKDEQRSRAFEVLEQLQTVYQDGYPGIVARYLGQVAFVPEADRHYHMALLYEVGGYLPEAREEWHNYIRSGEDVRHARRAREHIEAIEELMAAARTARRGGER